MTQKLARWVVWCCTAWLMAVPAGAFYFALNLDTFSALAMTHLALPIQWFSVNAFQWQALLALTFAYMCLSLAGTWYLLKAFRSFAAGHWFDESNSRHLRRFATLLMLQGAVRPVYLALASVLLSLNHPAGEQVLSLTAGSREVGLLVAGFVMWVLADLLVKGSDAANENRQFV